jgi:hypothetical protein
MAGQVKSPYVFTADVAVCKVDGTAVPDCYDNKSARTLTHFSGRLPWSDFAKNKMRFLLSGQ